MNYIPLEKCKNRSLYKIKSRNLEFGVFNKDTLGFIGIREKLGSEFLFTEYHCDSGFEIEFGDVDGRKRKASFGSVFPKKELERIPDELSLKPYFEIEKEGRKYAAINDDLFNWLNEKEIEYILSYLM